MHIAARLSGGDVIHGIWGDFLTVLSLRHEKGLASPSLFFQHLLSFRLNFFFEALSGEENQGEGKDE